MVGWKEISEESEDSEVPSFEDDTPLAKSSDEVNISMVSNKHRIALAAGVCGMLTLTGIIAVVSGFVGHNLKQVNASNGSTDNLFDVDDAFERAPTEKPSLMPSSNPTAAPTPSPSSGPSSTPSSTPSSEPTATASTSPSNNPTIPATSEIPSLAPSGSPVKAIDEGSESLLTFCVVADVPYFPDEERILPQQIGSQMDGCEFLVHLGDIKNGDDKCDQKLYRNVELTLMMSPVPTFIVVGDNEWNDCGNEKKIEAGWDLWTTHFMNLEDNWAHDFNVTRQPDYQENFYFIRKRTLVIGLNIVGGLVHDGDEWFRRLSSEAEWVRSLIQTIVPGSASGVIIMAHANPTNSHRHFFNPMKGYIAAEFQDIPILYLHGDGHEFIYRRNFYDQPNFLAIQHEGGVRDPILKILADPQALGPKVSDAFQYDQQLHLQ